MLDLLHKFLVNQYLMLYKLMVPLKQKNQSNFVYIYYV